MNCFVKLVRIPLNEVLPPMREMKLCGRIVRFTDNIKVKQEVTNLNVATVSQDISLNLGKETEDCDCRVIIPEGEIVFAKVKGFSFWPGKVVKCPQNSRRNVNNKRRRELSYKIQFFASHDTRSVKSKNIIFFNEANVKRLANHNFKGQYLTRLYRQALIEAKDVINVDF